MRFHNFCLLALVSLTFNGCKAKDFVSHLFSCVNESYQFNQLRGKPVATISGTVLTAQDIEENLKNSPPEYRQKITSSVDERSKYLDGLINEVVFAKLAREKGLDRRTEFLIAVERYKTAWLANAYRTDALLTVPENYSPPPFESAHPFQISQIVLKTAADAKKAQGLLKSGSAFSMVAQKMSMDTATAKSGGVYRIGLNNKLSPAIEKTLRNLGEGKVSDVMKTPAGYVLFRKDRVYKDTDPEIQSAKAQHRQFMYLNEMEQKGRSAMDIDVDASALDRVLPVR